MRSLKTQSKPQVVSYKVISANWMPDVWTSYDKEHHLTLSVEVIAVLIACSSGRCSLRLSSILLPCYSYNYNIGYFFSSIILVM